MTSRTSPAVSLISTLLAVITCTALRADWPMYRGNVERSRVAEGENLTFPMRRVWVYRPAQPPQPAWPPPPRLRNKTDFDYAPHPIVADGLVFVASNADDTVRALDVNNGVLKWRYTAGGPIRFAPQVWEGKVYFGSDDGHVYCLAADTGAERWRFRAAPESEQYIGNRRMISRWPLRCGILIRDGTVYTVAGMWPAEGIYVYALKADTGEQLWVNDRESLGKYRAAMYKSRWRPGDPHMGEFAMDGPTPQGALLAAGDTLIVPLCLNSSAAYSCRSGALISYAGRGSGSSKKFIDGNTSYCFLQWRSNGVTLFGVRADVKKRTPVVRYDLTHIPQVNYAARRYPAEEHSREGVSAIIYKTKLYARKAYGLALADNALLEGRLNRIVAADRETQKELWGHKVNGEARELAIADGRIFVGTSSGEVTCFVPGSESSSGARIPAKPRAAGPISVTARQVTEILRRRDAYRGFALVAGDIDGSLARGLAAGTDLRIVSVLTDEAAVKRLRNELLDKTSWYGSRIHVQHIADSGALPFAQYFANAVVVAGRTITIPGGELCRVLHPYGGVMVLSDPRHSSRNELPVKPDSADYRVERIGNMFCAIRGGLKGARNWDTNTSGDKRVKWPLRPLWFGGPDTALVMNALLGAHPPVASEGRYFVTGDDVLSAADAYNGALIWSRRIPSAQADTFQAANGLYYHITGGINSRAAGPQWGQVKRWLDADGKYVYLRLGTGYFREKGEALIQVDARTGEQVALCAPAIPQAAISLAEPHKWSLSHDDERSGEIAMAADDAGLVIRMSTKAPGMTEADTWDLFFDLRPIASRIGLYARGTFMLRLPGSADPGGPLRCLPGTGAVHPQVKLKAERTGTGASWQLLIPWKELEKIAGRRPKGFGFAATLTFDIGDFQETKGRDKKAIATIAKVAQKHVFADALAPAMNSGWANVWLGKLPADPAEPSAALLGNVEQRPGDWRWPDLSTYTPRPGISDYVGNPGRIDDAVREAPRSHALTGELGDRVYRSGTAGCGLPVFSSTTLVGRSNKLALAFYDFEDDSGLRFFPGISPNCGGAAKAINMTAALGVLIHSESRSHCDCMIPIRTTVVFALAERRLHEDWAIFSDRNADASIRRTVLNFGARGDRRDDNGTLWLRFPRGGGGKAYPLAPGSWDYVIEGPGIGSTVEVPMTVEPASFRYNRPFRMNADRTPIGNTDRPWIYASGYEGVRKLVLDLAPAKPFAAARMKSEPTIDGQIEQAAWIPMEDISDEELIAAEDIDSDKKFLRGKPEIVLKANRTDVFVRYDDTALYLGFRRTAAIDRRGKAQPWKAETSGEDADIQKDDSFEAFLSTEVGERIVHIGVAASGARYDALSTGGKPETASWNGEWRSAVVSTEDLLSAEIAMPWKTLADAGIDRNRLLINVQSIRKSLANEEPLYPGGIGRVANREHGIHQSLLSLGEGGRSRCGNFVAVGLGRVPPIPTRKFTMRLHFAEPAKETKPGDRVFDIAIQGKKVAEKFDMVAAAGGPLAAVVREFKGVIAGESITLELIPGEPKSTAVKPVINGLEIYEEEFLKNQRR